MDEMEYAGPGTPQGALIAECDFAAVDISFAVWESSPVAELLSDPLVEAHLAGVADNAGFEWTTDDFLEAMAEPGESREETIERLSTPIEKREWFCKALAIRRARNRLRKAEKRFAWRGMAARTLKPIAFIMLWLDLIGRLRKAIISAPCSVFSFPSCGGWTS